MSSEFESDEEMLSEWVRNPGTKAQLKRSREKRKALLMNLISSAESSSDPAIRAAAARFREAEGFVIVLGGKKLSEEKETHGEG